MRQKKVRNFCWRKVVTRNYLTQIKIKYYNTNKRGASHWCSQSEKEIDHKHIFKVFMEKIMNQLEKDMHPHNICTKIINIISAIFAPEQNARSASSETDLFFTFL